MKQKFTQIPKLLIICLLAFFGSCQKDFEEQIKPKETTQKSHLKTYYISGNKARLVAGKLGKQLGRSISAKGTKLETQSGTQIDYDSIMVVENEFNHTSYSFRVKSAVETDDKFQNMVLIEKNGETVTKLITYDMDPVFAAQYRADIKPMSKFVGTITIDNPDTPTNCCAPPRSEIIQVPGTGGGGGQPSTGGWEIGDGGGGTTNNNPTTLLCPSGQHEKGSFDCAYTDSGYTLSNRSAYTSVVNAGGIAPVICCIEDIGLYEEAIFKNDCEKLKKAVIQNPAVKQALLDLTPKTSMPTEQGFSKNTGSDALVPTVNGTSGSTEYVAPPAGQKMEIGAHTHNSPANNTYSIFSWEDLEALSRAANINQVADNYTAFLSTADGTNYAFTITDMKNFKKLYSAQQWNTTTYNQGLNKVIQEQRAKNYYGRIPNDNTEIIKANNTDYLADEKAFLKMLETLNCGVTLFEVDATFTTFTKVSLDPNDNNNILSVPCTN
jgi:hypothetical protein